MLTFGPITSNGSYVPFADIRELYLAQGFPAAYRIDASVGGKPLSKAAQVRMVGNSVSPQAAIALVAANVGELRRVEAA